MFTIFPTKDKLSFVDNMSGLTYNYLICIFFFAFACQFFFVSVLFVFVKIYLFISIFFLYTPSVLHFKFMMGNKFINTYISSNFMLPTPGI